MLQPLEDATRRQLAHVVRRPAPVEDLSGEVLDGRYRLLALIGDGTLGRLYRAERLGLGRVLAIKVMNAKANAQARARFEREAMTMAKLEHPHCASVLDVGVYRERPFVVMELVTGQPLSALIAGAPLPIARTVEIMRQVLSGLSHAHEHGIVHRDIKATNIVLAHKSALGDQVKILDFGVGTLDRDESATHSVGADLHACGVLLSQLVAPGALAAVISRALAKNLDERFQSADQFARALVAASSEATIQLDLDDLTLAQTSATMLRSIEETGEVSTRALPTKRPLARSLIAIAIAIAIIAGTIILATRSDLDPRAARVTPPTAASPAADATVTPPQVVERADERARTHYQTGMQYFAKMWWADGIAELRAAIKRDASYKNNPELIKLVVRAFNTTPRYDWRLARFLRDDIGPSAKPFLENTAQHHPNRRIRARAAAELRRSPYIRTLAGSAAAPSSSLSGGSSWARDATRS